MTSIAAGTSIRPLPRLMELLNEFYALEGALAPGTARRISEDLTLMLAPFAPYTAQDLWAELGHNDPVFRQPWPTFNPALQKKISSRFRYR